MRWTSLLSSGLTWREKMKIERFDVIMISILTVLAIASVFCFNNTVTKITEWAENKSEKEYTNIKYLVCGNTYVQKNINTLKSEGSKIIEIKALNPPHGIYGFYDVLITYVAAGEYSDET